MRGHGRHHMHQLGLIRAGHHRHVRQCRQIADVECPGMGRAVGTDKARAVEAKPHRKVLQRHVMDDLVIAALEEAGIDRAEGLQSASRHTGGERHRMLLGDADIEHAAGMGLAQRGQASASRHRGGHTYDLWLRVCKAR